MSFSRFVALGDSQTEGLWDGSDEAGLRGWADRLAEQLAVDNPDLLYANLAIRAMKTAQVRDDQLGAALDMRPDLVGICVGMNDVVSFLGDFADTLDVLEAMYARLAETGATVLTTTFPDFRRMYPMARLIWGRVERLNDRIRECAARYDLRLVDLMTAPSMVDLRMWSTDRVHGSPLGHERFAQAAAEALGLAGADHAWAEEISPPLPPVPWHAVAADEFEWARAVLGPWAIRRLHWKTPGSCRRPELAPVVPYAGDVGQPSRLRASNPASPARRAQR